MEKELKDYLRSVQGLSERDITRVEQNATEAELDVLRKGMRSWMELTGGKTPDQIMQEIQQDIQQEQQTFREKAFQAAQREARERRRKKKSQFALGFGIIPLVGVVAMLFGMAMDWIAEYNKPADMDAAFQSAQIYLEMGLSPAQLSEQMELEGFSTSEAKYIVENCDADWKEQAVLAAKGHRQYSELSEEELLEMLIFQGFSEEQAAYGVMNSK